MHHLFHLHISRSARKTNDTGLEAHSVDLYLKVRFRDMWLWKQAAVMSKDGSNWKCPCHCYSSLFNLNNPCLLLMLTRTH